MTKLRQPIITTALVLTLFFIFNILGIFDIPRLRSRDLLLTQKYKFSNKPNNLNNILIVEIADSDYKAFGEKWPLDRNIFATFTYKLNNSKPSVIGFALGFIGDNPGFKESDLLLADAFKEAGNVVLASYFDESGRYVLPLKELRESAAGYGFTNKPLDKDSVVRETKFFEKDNLTNEIIDYSFDLKIFNLFRKKDINAIIPRDQISLINFPARLVDFNNVSFSDIINDKVRPELIQDKIVLIGTTAEIFHEMYLTPLGRMPSVYIIANTILMFLNKTFIFQIPQIINYLILIFLAIMVSIKLSHTGLVRGGIFVFGILVLSIGMGIFLILKNIYFDIFSILLGLPIVYISSILTAYINLFIQGSQIKKMVVTDPLTRLPSRRYLLFKLEAEMKAGKDMSLCLFSIDNFEFIINEIGLENTNLLIKDIGKLITSLSRKTRGVDFIARYGETEFACVLHNTPEKGAVTYCERILENINKKITSVPAIIIRAGISVNKNIPYNSAKIFVKCTEFALSRAKKELKKKICIYDPKIDKISPEEYISGKEISEADLSYVAEELAENNKELAILLNKIHTLQHDVIASERLAAVGKLAATIQHDLSKPIVNIRKGLKAVKNDIDKINLKELSIDKEFINSSIEETERLEKLCWSLRELYLPMEKEFTEISINQILEELMGLSFAQIVKNNIKLIKNLDTNLPNITSNIGDLKQIFLNLIMNAIEVMPKGGELGIRTGLSEKIIEVTISDTGCGIPKENMDKLFKAFFTTKKDEKGSGLGLYSSMEIIKRYGGTIKVESEPNKGSIFKVYLNVK